jgi:hypothetical protein
MAASQQADDVPARLETVRQSLHTVAGTVLFIGSTRVDVRPARLSAGRPNNGELCIILWSLALYSASYPLKKVWLRREYGLWGRAGVGERERGEGELPFTHRRQRAKSIISGSKHLPRNCSTASLNSGFV